MTYYAYIESAIGKLLLTSDGKYLTGLSMENSAHAVAIQSTWQSNIMLPVFVETAGQIKEFLRGVRTAFDLPLKMDGTTFQKKVWNALKDIPYGETVSYKEIASKIGNPKATRAVGLANGRNPIPLIVPCHRVIGSDGKLVGYDGGLERKVHLLNLEQKFKS